MNNHTLKLKNSKNVLLITGVVLLVIAATVTLYVTQSKNEATVVTNTVELSTFHPTYASIDELKAASDATFVGQAIVLDDGTVRSEKVPNDPPEAPPIVSTEYKLEVQSVIKGKDTPSKITMSVMGGIVDDTRYLYEGIPKLQKGDTILVFALLGDDGKYYPLAGSTAIATRQEDGSYRLGEETLNTGARTFTEQDLSR